MFSGRKGFVFFRVVLPVIMLVLAFGLLGEANAQITTTTANISKGIRSVNAGLLGLVKGVMGLLLFGTALWQFIEGYTSGNLNSKWMSIIGIAIFLIALSQSASIYSLLIGGTKDTDVVETSQESLIW